MSRSNLRTAALLAAFSLGIAGTAQAQWGNLKGQFLFNGKAPEAKKLDTSKEPMCVPHNLTDEALVVGARRWHQGRRDLLPLEEREG